MLEGTFGLTLHVPAVDFNEFQYSHMRPQSCFSNLPFWEGKTLVSANMYMVKHKLFIENNIFRPEVVVAPLCVCIVWIRSRSKLCRSSHGRRSRSKSRL